ncbi:MAG: hypothetical protein ABR592_01355 [Nitriliruptorales bacterium]
MNSDVRDRLVLPILIPIGLLVIIAVLAAGFGMLLLFNPMAVSLMIAIVVSLGIIVAVALATSQTERALTKAKRGLLVFAAATPIMIGVLVATDVITTTSEKVVQRECEFCVPEDAVRVVARNLEFEQRFIDLPAEGEVSILFINEDAGIPHNVAIYPQDDSGEPVLSSPLFVGATFNGVDQEVYTLQAPAESDTYFYRCDVHPQMQGEAVFGPPSGQRIELPA